MIMVMMIHIHTTLCNMYITYSYICIYIFNIVKKGDIPALLIIPIKVTLTFFFLMVMDRLDDPVKWVKTCSCHFQLLIK
jgi:hypothetical protein